MSPAARRLLYALGFGVVAVTVLAIPNTASAPPLASAKSDDVRVANAALSAQASPWLVVAGKQVGPLTRSMSEDELLAQVAPGTARRDTIYIAEGFCTLGTLLFPDTPNEVQIRWQDSSRTRPAYAQMHNAGDGTAEWTTASGIRLGTTLRELESINQGPFEFGGIGWDYGGGVGGWFDGPLGEELKQGLSLRLYTTRDSMSTLFDHPRRDEIYGERSVASDHPVAQHAGFVVIEMTVSFGAPDPTAEFDCT